MDLRLSAHQFQPEFVPVSRMSEPVADAGALRGNVGSVSWSHPGQTQMAGLAAPPPPEHWDDTGAGVLAATAGCKAAVTG